MNTQPAIYTDRSRQLRGMISFHERAAKAYRAAGNEAQAAQADAQRAQCQAELDAIEANHE